MLLALGTHRQAVHYDVRLVLTSMTLLLLGLIMVASASVQPAQIHHQEPLYYFWQQLFHASIGILLALLVVRWPLMFWKKNAIFLLLLGLALLIGVFIPQLGHEAKGSLRWLNLGVFTLQPSEFMKLFMILYLADYLTRRSIEVKQTFGGFVKPLAVVCLITGLLLFEPDYGAIVVLLITVFGMLFLAGVPLGQFFLWLMMIMLALIIMMVLAPYRLERLTAFMNPWADPFDSGFQLTQALIAIGRGGLFGVGLGNSVQKLTYLPEAHTDFLFAILAEELGLIGVIVVMSLLSFIVLRAFVLGRQAEQAKLHYAAFLAYGIGLVIGCQASINLGVNMGLLPTKGLTLPLMSYGGSSLIVTCVMLALLLRVDSESQLRNQRD